MGEKAMNNGGRITEVKMMLKRGAARWKNDILKRKGQSGKVAKDFRNLGKILFFEIKLICQFLLIFFNLLLFTIIYYYLLNKKTR